MNIRLFLYGVAIWLVATAHETPDGRGLLFVKGWDIYFAKAEGTEPRKLLSASGYPFWPEYSPDKAHLRFSADDSKQNRVAIWEASPDGSNPHRFLPDWNPGGTECCGRWTPDGKYFVFHADVAGNSNIWAVREGGLFSKGSHEPIQLTTGPMQSIWPVASKDGKKIFFMGIQSRAELSVYDSRLREFVPYLGGISAEGVSFSRDGQWVTYVRLPERTLWRMKMDGTEQLQITFAPMKIYNPRWSPDGKRIAFHDVPPNGHTKIYIVSADGGSAKALTSGERNAGDPTWSPDGNSLVFHSNFDSPDSTIQVMNLNMRKVTELAGSKGLYSPRWSPDGQYLVALTVDGYKLMLFDFKTQKWEKLSDLMAGYPTWSKDGRYSYFEAELATRKTMSCYRLEMTTHKIEEVANVGNARQIVGNPGFPWQGVTPDGSPLIAREAGTQEIYALDVDFP